jgi:hypothetical protein
MTIDGVSQSTGGERLVDIAIENDGLKLTIRDRKAGTVLRSAIVSADALMTVLADQPEGPQTLTGTGKLVVEVRRNEVLLTMGGPDAAVGLDDLVDAVAGASAAGDVP